MTLTGSIQEFLRDIIVARTSLDVLPEFVATSDFDWLAYLKKNLHIVSFPVGFDVDVLQKNSIFFAVHINYGPILIRQNTGISNSECRILSLSSGKEYVTNLEQNKLFNCQYLQESFAIDEAVTETSLKRFLLNPVQHLSRLMVFFQVLRTMLSSLLFISNFAVLAYVVPSQNMQALQSIGWFIVFVIVLLMLVIYLTERTRIIMDSIVEVRTETLRFSLLLSMQPAYILSHGAIYVDQMCSALSQVGRASIEARSGVILAFMIIPVMALMYIRLPLYLFISTLSIILTSLAIQTYLKLRYKKLDKKLQEAQMVVDTNLKLGIANFKRLDFYGAVSSFLVNWIEANEWTNKLQARVSAGAHLEDEIGAFLKDLTLVIAMLVLTVLIAKTDTPLPISAVFIMLYLVQQINNTIPIGFMAFLKVIEVKNALNNSTDLLNTIEKNQLIQRPSITNIKMRINFEDLVLPHGCCFLAYPKGLSMDIKGKGVIKVNGESGCGKTTFLKCILGFSEPESGFVKVFGENPIHFSSKERQYVFSYADQHVQLLPGTIRENLCMLNSSKQSNKTLWEILDCVEMFDVVSALPGGLDTPIEETLGNFSLGERQRMVLAQCLAKKSKVLVLDEAMSAIAEDMEIRIFNNIRPLVDQIYLVSHRVHMDQFADLTIDLGKEEYDA
ncbi:MAG: ABC transporter ATP-binding protein [Porticoccus sp.]